MYQYQIFKNLNNHNELYYLYLPNNSEDESATYCFDINDTY